MYSVCGVLYNMAWTSGRAPLKQWKWLTVVSPPAARHTPQPAQLIWHCSKHSSQALAQSSRISVTHHKAGNLPALFCPNLCWWAAGQWTTRDTNVSFDSPLFSVCRVWAWLWLTRGAPLTRTIYFQFQQNPENFAKCLGSEAKRKVIGDRAPHILLSAEYVHNGENQSGGKGKS